MSEAKTPKPHPNDNIEILYKPYIQVRSDYESDETPLHVKSEEKLAFEKACPPLPAPQNSILTQTSDRRRFGFRHSYLPVDHEALCYTTLDSRLLVKKLALLPYKYEGGSAPVYKLGEMDSNFGSCRHCGKYSWSCHEIRFGKFCHKAVLRHFESIRYRHVNPEDAYVVFINFYNCALDFSTFDELQSDDESVLGDTNHSHPAKCMDYGSLIRTLEWAYWKQQRIKEKRRKRYRPGTSWISKKTSTGSPDKVEKGQDKKKSAT